VMAWLHHWSTWRFLIAHGGTEVTALPRQWLATAPQDTRGPRRSWLRFLKRRDAAHDHDGLRGMLRLLMPVSRVVSGCWSHKGHCSWHSMPLLANLSVVQYLLCSTSQTKNLHLLGAQDFHSFRKLKWNRSLKQGHVCCLGGEAAGGGQPPNVLVRHFRM
jgi:hypothetical protein